MQLLSRLRAAMLLAVAFVVLQLLAVQAQNVVVSTRKIDGDVHQYVYFGDNDVVALMTEDSFYIGYDHGKRWVTPDNIPSKPLAIVKHPADPRSIYLLTMSRTVYYSSNAGSTYTSFQAPAPPPSWGVPALSILRFHNSKGYMLWLGEKDDHSVLYLSKNNGKSWTALETYVENCNFVSNDVFKAKSDDTIVCIGFADKTGRQRDKNGKSHVLLYSTDMKTFKVALKNVLNYTVSSRFLVAAVKGDNNALYVSVNGVDFARAIFPVSTTPTGYTIMKGLPSSLFLDISMTGDTGLLVYSNWNGTVFHKSLDKIYKDKTTGISDFERIQGIEGVLLANINDEGSRKSRISFDDGESWQTLTTKSDCGNDEACTLHIHSYTERINKQDTYSVETSGGKMIAVGNTGKQLKSEPHDTFLSADGGITWKKIADGDLLWEFADKSQIITLVNPSDMSLKYSLDVGENFSEISIDNAPKIEHVSAMFSDPAGKTPYVIIAAKDDEGNRYIFTVDYSNVWPRDCSSVVLNDDASDLEHWKPHGDHCIFGHRTTEVRRKAKKVCSVRKINLAALKKVEHCACSSADFECGYNYELVDGKCFLVSGLRPYRECKNHELIEYGPYVRRKGSTCAGGDIQRVQRVVGICSNSTGGGFFSALFSVIWWLVKFVFFTSLIVLAVWLIYNKFHITEGRIRLPDANNHNVSRVLNAAQTTAAAVATVAVMLWSTGSYWVSTAFDKIFRRETGYEPVNGVWGGENDSNLFDLDVEDY